MTDAAGAPGGSRWFRAVIGGAFAAASTLGFSLAGCGVVAGVVVMVAGRADGEWGLFAAGLGLVAIATAAALAMVAREIGATVAAPCPTGTRRPVTAACTVAVGLVWTALLAPEVAHLDAMAAWAWLAPGVVTCIVGLAPVLRRQADGPLDRS